MNRIVAVYSALAATLFLSSLYQTAVVTALPQIVSDVGGFSSYSWVVTAYVLAMTVVVPVYGKLVDVYGGRRLLLVAVAIFALGSVLCATAQTMTQLVAYRALQGLGSGGLVPVVLSTVGTLVPPRDRGRYIAVIGATFAVAGAVGPPVGGLIADGPGWRWIFFLNLPFALIAIAAVLAVMPRGLSRGDRRIDYTGAVLVAGSSGLLLLGLVWGGHEYAWGSAQVMGAFAASAVLALLFALVERRAPEPVLPFRILRLPAVAVGTAASALLGMAMLGTVAFVPLFVQGVVGESATSSGVVVMPFVLSAVAASIVAGQISSRTGRYKAPIVVGLAVLVGGLALVWRMDVSTSGAEVARNAAVAGIGLGLGMQLLVVAVQNAVPVGEMGGATGLLHFTRSLGAALGVTVMGVISARDLPKGLDLRGPVPDEPPPVLAPLLAEALRPAFLFALCVCAAALVVVVLLLREVPLRRELEEPEPPATALGSGR